MYAGNETTPQTIGYFTGAYQITAESTVATAIVGYPYGTMATNVIYCGRSNDRSYGYAHLSRRARRLAEENERWAAVCGMSIVEYVHMLGRRPPLPELPRPPYRTTLRSRAVLAPRLDHLVHRMRIRDPGRWLAGAGRRACGRRREPIDPS